MKLAKIFTGDFISEEIQNLIFYSAHAQKKFQRVKFARTQIV